MKKRNRITKDLFTTKYRKRVIKPKRGKGSFRRKKANSGKSSSYYLNDF